MREQGSNYSYLLLIDLDHFKTINDTLGHDIGDKLLVEVSNRLKALSNAEDNVLSRLGGDEFCILSTHFKDKLECTYQAEFFAKELLASIRESYTLDGNHLHISASIGVSIVDKKNMDVANYLKLRISSKVILTCDFKLDELAIQYNKSLMEWAIENIVKNAVDSMESKGDLTITVFQQEDELIIDIKDSGKGIAANKLKDRLEIISQERITDEFLKILSSPKPSTGLILLYDSGVMGTIFPELANLAGVDQRKDYHHKDVFLHTCEVVDNISQKTDNVWLRFAALVHDIAKPQTKRFVEGTGWTFHGHEELGARMMKSLFRRMKLPFSKLHYIEKLIRLHLRPIALAKDEVTDSAVRRLIVSADEDLEDLIVLCRADITSKNPNKVSKYLQNYNNVMQKVIDVKEKDELSAVQSPIKGETIMEVCNLKPSKKDGEIKKAIEDAILDGKIGNNYEEAYEYLLKIKDDVI